MSAGVIVLWSLAGLLGSLAYARPGDLHVRGFKIARDHVVQVFPRLVLALATAGFVSQIVPNELVAGWLGAGSGMWGILIASAAGGIVHRHVIRTRVRCVAGGDEHPAVAARLSGPVLIHTAGLETGAVGK